MNDDDHPKRSGEARTPEARERGDPRPEDGEFEHETAASKGAPSPRSQRTGRSPVLNPQ